MAKDTENPYIEALKAELTTFPTHPGVYIMKDEDGEVIYVGKAKNLRARVRSYFAGGDGRHSIKFLLRRIAKLEKIVTESEEQAFVLERDLITKYKPRYNIRLKDDKSYLSIRIDENEKWPRIRLVRRVEQDGARYFGPYTFSYELRTILDLIKRVVPLRTCTDTVLYNRQRPCLEYQIKRCLAPCCLEVADDEYHGLLKQAISILEGNTSALEGELERLMELASEDLRFEDAALYRDRIEILQSFGKGMQIVSTRGENRDVFALYREEQLAALSVLQVRNGRVADSVNFTFSDLSISDEMIVEAALEQFYQGGREIPEEIISPFESEGLDLIRQHLKDKRGAALAVQVPKRGLKYRLLKLGQLNAQEHFIGKFDAEARYQSIANGIAKLFKLPQMPRRIECIDISNLGGSNIVGALVSFYDGKPDKQRYKRYKISTQGKPDDFGSINEVVSRRLKRGLEEDDLPDLLVIDGGAGQLNAALAARDELGVNLDIVSIAKIKATGKKTGSGPLQKKPERIFLPGASESIALPGGSELTHLMQRIRDEVHRFVITFHRERRAKQATSSVLDSISGVGPERRGRLLRRFGSVKAMKGVAASELAKAGRMPLSLAEKVYAIINAS